MDGAVGELDPAEAAATSGPSRPPVLARLRALAAPEGRLPVAALVALVLSRLLYWALGLRFDVAFSGSAMQLADLDLLRSDPLGTAWYFHNQPPTFNVLVGVVAWATGDLAGLAFQALYLAATVVTLVSLYRLALDLGLHRWWASAIAVLVAISPTVALYEHTLFYTHLELVGLVVVVRQLQRWALGEGTRPLVLASVVLALLATGRSLYHPLWLLALLVWLGLLAGRQRWKPVVVAVVVPLVLVGAVMAKNQAVFGWATTGSLEGINLHRITEPYLTDEERAALLGDGTITDVSTEAFSCQRSPEQFPPAGPDRPIAVLDRQTRAADERLQNLNRRTNVECLRQLRSESLDVLTSEPDAYLRAVRRAAAIAWYPSAVDVRARAGNQDALAGPGRVEGLVLGALEPAPSPLDASFGDVLGTRMQWLLLLATAVALAALAVELVRPANDLLRRQRVVLGAMLALIATASVLSQLTEVGENNRLAAVARPLVLVGVGLAAARIAAQRRRPVT